MTTTAIHLLRAALALVLVGTVLLQLLMPQLAHAMGGQYWETVHLVVPYAVMGILSIVCVQVAVVVVWRLLALVEAQLIFTTAALRWVDVLAVTLALAALLPAATMAHLLFVVAVGGPGILLGLAACVTGGAALVLLVRVMRGLLTAAIADRSELDEVI